MLAKCISPICNTIHSHLFVAVVVTCRRIPLDWNVKIRRKCDSESQNSASSTVVGLCPVARMVATEILPDDLMSVMKSDPLLKLNVANCLNVDAIIFGLCEVLSTTAYDTCRCTVNFSSKVSLSQD